MFVQRKLNFSEFVLAKYFLNSLHISELIHFTLLFIKVLKLHLTLFYYSTQLKTFLLGLKRLVFLIYKRLYQSKPEKKSN